MKPTQRLDKILSHSGYGTRREIKKLVKNDAVRVNGVTVRDGGMQVDWRHDVIEVHGKQVMYRKFIYIMMNKPQGVVSATEDARERTVVDLLSEEYRRFHPFPAGRLDKDTEGLLLLTNDGKLAHRLLSPRMKVPKTYYAEVEGEVTDGDMAAFAEGVKLDDGYVTMPAALRLISYGRLSGNPVSHVELTITEGKYHQVKRMFLAVGKRVMYLKRTAMGPLRLDESLIPGSYRELDEREIAQLQHLFE